MEFWWLLLGLDAVVVVLALVWLVVYRPRVHRWTPEAWLIRLCALVPLQWALHGTVDAPTVCDNPSRLRVACWVGELASPVVSLAFLGAMFWARRRFAARPDDGG